MLSTLAAYVSLSRTVTVRSVVSTRCRTKLDPMKPAPPVTMTDRMQGSLVNAGRRSAEFTRRPSCRRPGDRRTADGGGMTDIVWTLALGLCLAFAESGLGLGIVLPGETAVVVLAATLGSTAQMVGLGIAVAVGASLGDHVGYLLGRRYGEALRETRAVTRLGRHRYDRATDLLRRRGGAAVLMTRLVPVVRTLTPAAAGASGLAYRRFAAASVAGSAVWSTAYVGGGSVVAGLVAVTNDWLGRASWLLLVLVALTVVPVVLVRTVVGVRPVVAAPDVASLELATGVMPRRSQTDLVIR
jgi:membrane-associated protein